MRLWQKIAFNLFAALFIEGCAFHSQEALSRKALQCEELLPEQKAYVVGGDRTLRFKNDRLVKIATFHQKPQKDYETFYVSEHGGVAPQFNLPEKGKIYLCGKALFVMNMQDDHWLCESRFSKYTPLKDLGLKVFGTVLTYGMYAPVAIGTYSVEFDRESFDEFVQEQHISFNAPIFYELPEKYTFNLLDPRKLAQNDWGRNVVFYNQKSDLLFGYALANETDLLDKLAKRAQEIYFAYDEALYNFYRSKMPAVVKPPHIEPKRVVEKGEFETTSQFLQRVERIKEKERKRIERLRRAYVKEVEQRNRRVKELEKEMQERRKKLKRCFDDFLTYLKNRAVVLSYVRHINGASEPVRKRYDADRGRYYFIFETRNAKHLEGFVSLDPRNAKKLSLQKIELLPKVAVNGNSVEVVGYTVNGHSFHLTQMPNFELDRVSLVMQTKVEPREHLVLTYQEPLPFGIHQNWIIKTLSSAKIDAPTWFTHPDGSISGYGFGESYEKAYDNAVRNLAMALYTRVESEARIVATNEGENYDVKSRLYTIKELRKKVRVIKQENRNGWWYVKVGLQKTQ